MLVERKRGGGRRVNPRGRAGQGDRSEDRADCAKGSRRRRAPVKTESSRTERLVAGREMRATLLRVRSVRCRLCREAGDVGGAGRPLSSTSMLAGPPQASAPTCVSPISSSSAICVASLLRAHTTTRRITSRHHRRYVAEIGRATLSNGIEGSGDWPQVVRAWPALRAARRFRRPSKGRQRGSQQHLVLASSLQRQRTRSDTLSCESPSFSSLCPLLLATMEGTVCLHPLAPARPDDGGPRRAGPGHQSPRPRPCPRRSTMLAKCTGNQATADHPCPTLPSPLAPLPTPASQQ